MLQTAYLSLSQRFRESQMTTRKDLACGPLTSCRFARWEAGHQMGRTCESRGAIFGLTCDVTSKGRRTHMPTAAGRYTLRSRICWRALRQVVTPGMSAPEFTSRPHLYLYRWLFCLEPVWFPKTSHVFRYIRRPRLDASLERRVTKSKNSFTVCAKRSARSAAKGKSEIRCYDEQRYK